jgi:SAM-dependent methyltransferase
MAFEDESLDAVFTFNAIHHFDFAEFLARAGRAIRKDGLIFIYTRTQEQNAGSIWGLYFPAFHEKETRLYRRDEMERWVGEAGRLRLIAAKTFRYARTSSLERLLEQARRRHYSTFSLYSAAEFVEACQSFEDSVRRRFDDPAEVTWHDQNILLVIGRNAA